MRKKGFTLVELLATIIVLSIIALIATPIILGVIEDAKKGALKSSALGLIESANMYYANQMIKGENTSEKVTFDFEEGVQTSDEKLSYKGQVYNGKLILTEASDIVLCIDDGKYYAYKEKDSDEVVSGVGTCSYEDDKFIIQSDIEKCEQDCDLAKKELQSQIKDLTDLVNELRRIIAERESTIEGLNNQIIVLEHEKLILQDKLNDANQSIDELLRRIAELESQITGLNNLIKTLEGEKADLEAALAAKTEELENLNEQLGKVTATASDVLSGKTIYRKDEGLVTGTMPNRGAYTASVSLYFGNSTLYTRIPQGAYLTNTGAGYPEITIAGSSLGNASTSQVLSGSTFTSSNGLSVKGTMPNLSSNTTITHSSSNGTKVILGDAAFYSTNSDGTNRFQIRYNGSAGYINANTLFAVSYDTVRNTVGLTADKLKAGQSVLGVTGTYTSDANATAAHILKDKTAYVDGSLVKGTMANNAALTHAVSVGTNGTTKYFRIPTGAYLNLQATGYPEIYATATEIDSNIVAANIKKGVSIAGVTGTYTSDATVTSNSQILSGYSAYSNGTKYTGTIPSKGAQTYTPGTSNQTIASGQYLSGTQTITGDADLKAENIKSGVNIFGVNGTYTSSTMAVRKKNISSGKANAVTVPTGYNQVFVVISDGSTAGVLTLKVYIDGVEYTPSYGASAVVENALRSTARFVIAEIDPSVSHTIYYTKSGGSGTTVSSMAVFY